MEGDVYEPSSGQGKNLVAAKLRDIGDRYSNWFNVEHSFPSKLDDYVTEALFFFPGGWIESRHFSWSQPIELSWSTGKRCYFLDLSLTGRRPIATTTYIKNKDDVVSDDLGRVHLVPPNQTMRSRSLEGRARSIRCVLDAALVESFLPRDLGWDWDRHSFHNSAQLCGGEIEWLLRRMYREVHKPDFASVEVLEMLARQTAIEIVRCFSRQSTVNGRRVGGLAPWHLRLIRERLYADRPLPDVKELAGLCDMTVRHLSRAFRAETGGTIGKYIESVMAERACEMLTAGRPVGEVASSLGYATSGSFSSGFHRATGLMPSEIKPGGIPNPRPKGARSVSRISASTE